MGSTQERLAEDGKGQHPGHRGWEEDLGQLMGPTLSGHNLPTPWKASARKETWCSGKQVQDW